MLKLVKNIQTIVFTLTGAIVGAITSTVLVFLCGVKPSLVLVLPILLFAIGGYLIYKLFVGSLLDSVFGFGIFDETETEEEVAE